MLPARLALLVCDTPNEAVLKTAGDYPTIWKKYLEATFPKSASEQGGTFELHTFDVVHERRYPSLDDQWDAIILTGSGASVLRWL